MGTIKEFLMFACILIILPKAWCDCKLKVQAESPVIKRIFGSRQIVQRNFNGDIAISINETVDVYCSGKVITKTYYTEYTTQQDNISKLKLQCLDKNIFIINDHYDRSQFNNDYMFVSCDNKVLQLFESNSTLPNCNSYLSYGIGSKEIRSNWITTVAICYDLETLTIKYAKYLAYRPKLDMVDYEEVQLNETIVDLDIKLDKFQFLFNFGSNDAFKKYSQSGMILTPPLTLSNEFDYLPLLQDHLMVKDLQDFEYIFNIIWWKSLRYGNWNNFLSALKERSKKVTYLAYTGVSGTLKIPSFWNAWKNEDLQAIVNENRDTVKAPAYIWTYLKSLDNNIDEEFVVIAHNTPFYNVGSAEKFCEDKCHEIEWLYKRQFGQLHMMPIHGVVHCCHPAEVAHLLDNFPYKHVEHLSSTEELISIESTTDVSDI